MTKEGEIGNNLYVFFTGQLKVEKNNNNSEQFKIPVCLLSHPCLVGEEILVTE